MSNDDDNNNNVLKYDINTMSAEAAEKKTISNGLSSAKTIGPRRRTRLPGRRQAVNFRATVGTVVSSRDLK